MRLISTGSFRNRPADLEEPETIATRPGAWRAPATAAAAAAARSGKKFLRSAAFLSTFVVPIETAETRSSRRLSAAIVPQSLPGSPGLAGAEMADFPGGSGHSAIAGSKGRGSGLSHSISTGEFISTGSGDLL